MLKKLIFPALFTAFAACATASDRLALVALQSDLELRSRVGSAMVHTVSLPSYAAADDIAYETGTGLIATKTGALWADDPQRAVTLAITRNLADILNTDVGPDPWPLGGRPAVAIDIRVERMLAGADGIFHLTGQYYIGGDGIDFRNRSVPFAVSIPMPNQNLNSISTAQSQALLTLSEQIARTLAR